MLVFHNCYSLFVESLSEFQFFLKLETQCWHCSRSRCWSPVMRWSTFWKSIFQNFILFKKYLLLLLVYLRHPHLPSSGPWILLLLSPGLYKFLEAIVSTSRIEMEQFLEKNFTDKVHVDLNNNLLLPLIWLNLLAMVTALAMVEHFLEKYFSEEFCRSKIYLFGSWT